MIEVVISLEREVCNDCPPLGRKLGPLRMLQCLQKKLKTENVSPNSIVNY
jgi:hypothetical protein